MTLDLGNFAEMQPLARDFFLCEKHHYERQTSGMAGVQARIPQSHKEAGVETNGTLSSFSVSVSRVLLVESPMGSLITLVANLMSDFEL